MPLSDRDRRTLKIGGVIAGVLVVAILLMKLLSGGGEEAAPPVVPSPPGTSTSPSGSPSASVSPSPVFNPTGRDPFSIPAYFGVTTTTTTTTTSTSTTTTTTTPTGTTTSTPTQTPTGSNPSRATLGGHDVVLLDTFRRHGTDMAQVEVDATVYTVAEGATFAQGQFELRSVSGNFATILFGDESVTLRALHPK
jgi:hypothetical protein